MLHTAQPVKHDGHLHGEYCTELWCNSVACVRSALFLQVQRANISNYFAFKVINVQTGLMEFLLHKSCYVTVFQTLIILNNKSL